MTSKISTPRRKDRADQTIPTPCLFFVFAAHEPFVPPIRFSLLAIHRAIIGRGERRRAIESTKGPELDIRMPDPYMSGSHALIEYRSDGRWVLSDTSKNGTFRNGERVLRLVTLNDGDVIECSSTFFVFRTGVPAIPSDGREVEVAGPKSRDLRMRSIVPALQAVYDKIERIAPQGVSVLIEGETGTGKEVLARAIHELSGRTGPLVAVNCGAIPETLIESELFGSLKGAFSGATEDRQGLIRSAHRGTLLLDEIGDLPLASQSALLRVLQEREVMPVGGTRPVSVDVRFISATHRDLNAMVQKGTFRKDLLARIGQHREALPPLRARREDLGLLIGNILRGIGATNRTLIVAEAARALLLHEWPLNVRELQQSLQSALALAEGLPIDTEHLPADVSGAALPAAEDRRARDVKLRAMLEAELEKHGGNVAAVARALGKDRRQIVRWLSRFSIQPTVYRS